MDDGCSRGQLLLNTNSKTYRNNKACAWNYIDTNKTLKLSPSSTFLNSLPINLSQLAPTPRNTTTNDAPEFPHVIDTVRVTSNGNCFVSEAQYITGDGDSGAAERDCAIASMREELLAGAGEDVEGGGGVGGEEHDVDLIGTGGDIRDRSGEGQSRWEEGEEDGGELHGVEGWRLNSTDDGKVRLKRSGWYLHRVRNVVLMDGRMGNG